MEYTTYSIQPIDLPRPAARRSPLGTHYIHFTDASSLGYGFVWNSPAYGYTDISETEITWFANATLGADMWITTTSAGFDATSGKSPYAELLKHYVDAVGHASTMPYYSTGFIQCKDRYRNQTQVLDVARGYIERQLPISVIVIDWMHWVAQVWQRSLEIHPLDRSPASLYTVCHHHSGVANDSRIVNL
jgi:alpha-glucosidase (family GH31 glycosyl hydrolase)